MKKIIWISSYPKSGNTWMRFLVSNYFFNKEKLTYVGINLLDNPTLEEYNENTIYIVSADFEKIINKMPSINTNTIAVLFDEQNVTTEGLIRNLIHFEFCMQNNTTFKKPGSIYLIDTDRNIFLR